MNNETVKTKILIPKLISLLTDSVEKEKRRLNVQDLEYRKKVQKWRADMIAFIKSKVIYRVAHWKMQHLTSRYNELELLEGHPKCPESPDRRKLEYLERSLRLFLSTSQKWVMLNQKQLSDYMGENS